ncbi:hypothetical protein HWX16_23625, partial [Ochrobactrum intermedium]|nr:hypothetical protein [Brucella intermedia]
KETPVDADSIVIVDSADSNKPKKTLWSKIKALVNPDNVGLAIVASQAMPGVTATDTVAGLSGSGAPLRKWTWGNIRDWLRDIYDARYVQMGSPKITAVAIEFLNTSLNYLYWKAQHVAFIKKDGPFSFYWRK